MKNKYLFPAIIGIAIVGIIVGIVLNYQNQGNLTPVEQSADRNLNVTTMPLKNSENRAPTPTFSPVNDTVKTVLSDRIVLTGKAGDLSLPKDPAKIKVFKKSGTQYVPSDFSAVKVGQKATVKNINPGKSADLYIED